MESGKQSGFVIGDRRYEAPFFGDLDMNEWEVVYAYCGLTLEDILPADPDADEDEQAEHEATVDEKTRHPGFKKAMLHIAYQRGNPDTKPSKVKEIVGKVKLVDAFFAALEDEQEEADASPPELASTSEPAESSLRSDPGSSESSSSVSPDSADEPDGPPATTGISGSDTPSPELAPTT